MKEAGKLTLEPPPPLPLGSIKEAEKLMREVGRIEGLSPSALQEECRELGTNFDSMAEHKALVAA